jgi:AcrR family transcriptional regulator
MASERRFGSEDSEARERFLNAAEELLRTQGHSAVTVRRVAEMAGLKRQLVHYYFRSMEDLLLEVLRRAYDRHFARLAEALNAPNPVRSLWNAVFLREAILLEIYTLPLANEFDSVRTSIAEFMTRSRRLQVEALRPLLAARGERAAGLSAEAVAVFIRGIAREIAVETNLGVTEGHAEALAALETCLQRFDPGPASND